ncbi:MAG: hypothetical protein V3V08_23620, partial [Nannocystaceae bacterium]
FNGGEISPMTAGRSDVSRYNSSLSLAENWHILTAGPIRRRSGTAFVTEVLDSTDKGRLHPFVFSESLAYTLEFADNVMRVYKDEALLTLVAPTTGAPNLTTTYPVGDAFALNYTQSADILYTTHTDHRPRKISRTSDTVWSIDDIITLDGPYQDLNTSSTTLTITDPAVGSAKACVASADTFVAEDADALDGGGLTRGRLVRWRNKEGNVWGWGRVTLFTDEQNVELEILRAANGDATLATVDWRLGAWGEAAGLSYPTTVAFYQNRLVFAGGDGAPETIWASVTGDYENFSPTDDVDADENPSGVSLSNVQNDSAFTFTMSAGATGQVNVIRWLSPSSNDLVIGTTGGTSTLSSDQTGPVTPTNVFIREANTYGTKNVAPARVEDFVVHISHTGRKVRGLGYNFNADGWVSEDLTAIADEILNSGVTQMAFQKEPHGTIWMVRDDGQMIGLTLERTQKVAGFTRFIAGGTFGPLDVATTEIDVDTDTISTAHSFAEGAGPMRLATTDTLPGGLRDDLNYFIRLTAAGEILLTLAPGAQNPVDITDVGAGTLTIKPRAVVESVAVIPATASSSDHDQVWLIVKRTVDGSTVRYVEFMKNDFAVGGNKTNGWFVDSGYTQSGSDLTITTAGNLNHLIGETVQVLGDGADQGDRVVDASGQVAIDPAADVVQVGLGYESNGFSNDFELTTRDSPTSQGKRSRLTNLALRLDSTVGGEFGPDSASLEPIRYREPADLMDESPPLFTGDTEPLETTNDWSRNRRTYVRQDRPYPMTLVAWMPWFEIANR